MGGDHHVLDDDLRDVLVAWKQVFHEVRVARLSVLVIDDFLEQRSADAEGDTALREFAYDVVGEIVRPLLMERLAAAVTLVPKRGVKRIESGGVIVDRPGAFPPTWNPCGSGQWMRA
jgi:hypothetical protein